jgi:hypothetical protein
MVIIEYKEREKRREETRIFLLPLRSVVQGEREYLNQHFFLSLSLPLPINREIEFNNSHE